MWFEKAAASGVPQAMLNLGKMLENVSEKHTCSVSFSGFILRVLLHATCSLSIFDVYTLCCNTNGRLCRLGGWYCFGPPLVTTRGSSDARWLGCDKHVPREGTREAGGGESLASLVPRGTQSYPTFSVVR